MSESQKQTLLLQAKNHITDIQQKITVNIELREKKDQVKKREVIRMSVVDALTERILIAHNQEKISHLKQLFPSPYFTRCDFEMNGEKKIMYFGKFSFSEEGIYSWVTPIATLRFENPGATSYTRPDGKIQKGIIDRKDQYMVVDGKLIFFSTEGMGKARELIYQENFTRQKEGFILPEVVEQMEKAQDQVIRADHDGPFVITGPAGSGKTTLALHRVAYLMQSPETIELFPLETILVLVQDAGTKEYFSHLLPDLGIKGVSIVTFEEWARTILQADDYKYISDYGEFEDTRITYEYAKLQALKNVTAEYGKNFYAVLQNAYEEYLSKEHLEIFLWQKKNKLFDRFDLSVLLSSYQKKYGDFSVEKEYYQELANGSYRKKNGSFPVRYNLMIIDEFQNYLPEQLRILNSCLNDRIKSVVYVGDLAQQTQLGTIHSFESMGVSVGADRVVKLQKVYRNTKEILAYIQKLGFDIEIPAQIKSGEEVEEIALPSIEKEIDFIADFVTKEKDGTIGVLARSKEYLKKFKIYFQNNSRVHVLSFYESQGVEFDAVFIVGVGEKPESNLEKLPVELLVEIKKIENDLLYVALTRAMSRLWVVGRSNL